MPRVRVRANTTNITSDNEERATSAKGGGTPRTSSAITRAWSASEMSATAKRDG